MRRPWRIAVVAALLSACSATADLPEDDACGLALHGTFEDVATSVRASIPAARGLKTGACVGGDARADQVYFLVVPSEGAKAFVLEGSRNPRCAGGGTVGRIGVFTVRNDALEVMEVSSGGLGTMRWFQWVADAMRKGPLRTARSFGEVFAQRPSRPCDPNNEFPG